MKTLDLKQAAAFLGIPEQLLVQRAKRGDIQCFDESDDGMEFLELELQRYVRGPKRNQENIKRNARLATKREQLRPKLASYFSWHRASTKRRTPVWADRKAIVNFYLMAQRLSLETGFKHHVDHIIPLHGKLASGLHVHYNLRVVPAFVNQSKGNRLDR